MTTPVASRSAAPAKGLLLPAMVIPTSGEPYDAFNIKVEVSSITFSSLSTAPYHSVRSPVMHISVTTLFFAAVAVVVEAAPAASPMALPTPPNIPSASTAKSQLAALAVRTTDPSGYNRDLFPHWITISGTCNTRETVLKRDGTNVVTDSSCAAVSGSWYSPYDGATWSAAADVDIDHIVPLADAWRSGANTWTTARRQQFANDLTNPQLIAVTDNVNQAKGDKSPDAWKPPLTSYYCTYAKMWVAVKYVYGLSVKSAEKSALTSMLNTC